MGEAYVTENGLARHLGEKIGLTKKGKDAKTRRLGDLAFFPDKFVCLVYNGGKVPEIISIEEGDSVGLRHVTPDRKDSYLHEYVYRPKIWYFK